MQQESLQQNLNHTYVALKMTNVDDSFVMIPPFSLDFQFSNAFGYLLLGELMRAKLHCYYSVSILSG